MNKKTTTVVWATLLIVSCLVSCSTPEQNVSDLNLVPFPKEVEMAAGQRFSLKSSLRLHIAAKDRERLGLSLVEEMKRAGFREPQLIEHTMTPSCLMLTQGNVTLAIPELPKQAGEGKSNVEEAYVITITPQGIGCFGAGESGLFYAVQTLRQLIRANTDVKGNLPCMTIRDWPSMKYRCYQDDWTRGPSPLLAAAFETLERGSELKHNMFTYYMEDQFEFKKHPKLNPKDGTLSQEEFKQIVEHAARQHMVVLGNQQSFGHHSKTLRIPEYAHLGEAGYILSPTVEEVYTFLDDLYSEILPLTPFEMFNVCCDETDALAKSGPSKVLADKIGVGGVYVRHILRIRELLKKYDKRMLMWGDIILQHPDKLDLIPKDVVMMCWMYEPLPDFNALIKPFSDSGYEFFVCPGQSNWQVIFPLVRHYTVNIQNFVRDGCAHGAIGMLNTGWEDDGEALHGYTWHAIAWGAECSWNASRTEPADFNKRIGPVLFGAKGDDFGRAIEMLGELQDSPEWWTTIDSPFYNSAGSRFWSSNNLRFWKRDFVPAEPPDTVEKKAKRILELVQPAIRHLQITKEQATVNAQLHESFLFGARRMELIATRMLDGLEVYRRYSAVTALDLTDTEQKKTALNELETVIRVIDNNRKSHSALKMEFVRLWNSESKPYSLDWTTYKYDQLDSWFAELQQKVRDVQKTISGNDQNATVPDIDHLFNH